MSIVSRSTQQYSGFDPRTIPGCALWLDAADRNTISFSSGSNVSQWRDKSGNGRNASQSTSSLQPVLQTNQLSGLPGIKWDGVDDRLAGSYTYPTQTTFFIVYEATSSPSNQRVFDMEGNGYGNFGSPESNGTVDAVIWLGNGGFTTQATPTAGVKLYSVVYNQTSSAIWRFGVSMATNGTGGTTTPTGTNYSLGDHYSGINTNQRFSGRMYEILLFSGILTTAQRQQVEGYLAWKWSLTTNAGLVSPSTIPGLALWLDAADTTSYTSSAGIITSIRDKSPQSNTVTVQSPPITTNGINNLPTVTFTGSQWFRGNFSSTYAGNSLIVFAVASSASGMSTYARLVSLSKPGVFDYNSSGQVIPLLKNLNSAGIASYRVSQLATVSSLTDGINYLMCAEFTGSSNNIYINGVLSATIASSGNFDISNFGIGYLADYGGTADQAYWRGNLGEVILYFGTLTTTQRQQVEGYLAWKWGLQRSLPTSHPYNSPFALPTSHPFRSTPVFTRPFLPIDIDGLQLWLDAADATTVTGTTNITALRDKSSNGYIFSNATGFSYNTTLFQGRFPSFYRGTSASSVHLGSNTSISFTQPMTFFTVCSIIDIVNGGYIFDSTNTGNRMAFTAYAPAQPVMFAGVELFHTNANAFTSPSIHSGTFNGSSSTMFQNGTLITTGNAGTQGATGLILGARFNAVQCWTGHICELLIYSGTPTTTQRQQVEGYLAAKWGLSTSLPPAFPAVPSIFDPRTISGCQLWLDAADSSTLSPSTGSLSTWTNKGSAGGSATSSGTVAPTISNYNGYPSLYFPGSSNTVLTTSSFSYGSTGTTWFVVAFNLDSTAGLERGALTTVVGVQPERSIRFTNYANANAIYTINNSTLRGYAGSGIIPANGILCFTDSASLFQAFVNGTSVASNTTTVTYQTTSQVIQIGKWTNSMLGHIQEVLIYDSVLTTAQRQQVEGYLYAKWNIPLTRHPYYRIQSLPTTPIFTPASLSGLQLWLDGADPNGNGTLPTSGSQLVTWVDKSGNTNNANGVNNGGTWTIADRAINLNGTNQSYLFANPTTLAVNKAFIFFIVERRQKAGVMPLLGGTGESPNTNLLFQYGEYPTGQYNTMLDFYGTGEYRTYFENYSQTSETTRIWTGVYTGSQRYVFLNGRRQGASYNPGATSPNANDNFSSNVTSWTGGGIGRIYAGRPYDTWYQGKIYEIIWFTSLTDSQRQAVEGYLAWKWGLQNNLPLNFNRTIQSPLAISGCSLWLDAADPAGTGVVPANGASIATWVNKSGGTNATAVRTSPTFSTSPLGIVLSSNNPMNAGNAIVNSASYSMFMVARSSVTDGHLLGPWKNQYGSFGHFQCANPMIKANITTGTTYAQPITIAQALGTSGPRVFALSITSGTTSTAIASVDGVKSYFTIASANYAGQDQNFGIGGLYENGGIGGTACTMHEIIVYKAGLTADQVSQVEAYLQNKWNVAVPTAHPYKNFRP